MAVAILAYFIIVDFPTSAKNKFLTDDEKRFVVERLAQDRGAEDEKAKVTWKVVLHTFLDWKIWSFSMMYFAGAGYVFFTFTKMEKIALIMHCSGVYAFALFLPIILRNSLDFSLELSFVLSAFPPVFAILVVMPVAWLADKYHQRGIPTIFQGVLGVVGLCMTGFLDAPVPRYIGECSLVGKSHGIKVS